MTLTLCLGTVGTASSGFLTSGSILTEYIWDGSEGDVVIPDDVRVIGEDAFRDCTGVTSVTIPDSVTRSGTMRSLNVPA